MVQERGAKVWLQCCRGLLRCTLFVGLSLSAGASAAQEAIPVRPGLMWNKTGLPAVFPLQVRTAPGLNYFMMLHDVETDVAALAAYIKGGTHFRVLVPPGTFKVRFASGQIWQGETVLFGAGSKTKFIDIAAPLSFAVTGFGTKSGHVLDLRKLTGREASGVLIAPRSICQAYRLVSSPSIWGVLPDRRLGGIPVSMPEYTRAWKPQHYPIAAGPMGAGGRHLLNLPERFVGVRVPGRRAYALRSNVPGGWAYPGIAVRTRPCHVAEPRNTHEKAAPEGAAF